MNSPFRSSSRRWTTAVLVGLLAAALYLPTVRFALYFLRVYLILLLTLLVVRFVQVLR